MHTKDVYPQTDDGVTLAATQYTPDATAEAVVVINSALATPRRFYDDLAVWLAEQGMGVLTYDYRGIGDSPLDGPADGNWTLTDWVRQDVPAVLGFAGDLPGVEKRYVIGHSLGGQMMGVLGDRFAISGMATVCAQSGYWRRQAPGERVKTAIFMYTVIPLLSRLLGRFPWGTLVGGEDIPRGVALQWARWCRNPDYLLGDEDLPNREGFQRFSAPILAYSFEDDPWGWEESVDWMMARYTNATVHRVHVHPDDVDRDSIGHFGFFHPESEPLWEAMLDRLIAIADDSS